MHSVHTTVASRNQRLNSANNGLNSSTIKPLLRNAWGWLRIGAVATLVVGLVGASAYFNGLFGWTTSGVALAVAAVCFDLLKPVFHATKGWAVAAWVATAMSLVAAFSYQTINRGHLAEAHTAAVTEKSDARAAYDRAVEARTLAKAELAALPQTRPVAATQAEIRSILAMPGVECQAPKSSALYGPISKRWCPQVETLKAGLAVAQRRAELLTIINKSIVAPKVPAKTTKDVSAPSQSFAGLLAALGIKTTADFIAGLSVLFYVIGLEIGSSRALVLVHQIYGVPNRVPSQKTSVPGVSRKDDENDSAGTPEVTILNHVKANGGTLRAGQRRIAELMQVSKSEANRVLRSLADEGRLFLTTDRNGTTLKLA